MVRQCSCKGRSLSLLNLQNIAGSPVCVGSLVPKVLGHGGLSLDVIRFWPHVKLVQPTASMQSKRTVRDIAK